MAYFGIVKDRSVKLFHLPTFMLLIGYPLYWLELFLFNRHNGIVSPCAWMLFLLAGIIFGDSKVFLPLERVKAKWENIGTAGKFYGFFSAAIILAIIIIVFYASLLPPHLSQEFDALNYHITMPRQHLILGSFRHIPWSSADLFLLPVDFALAPYWLTTELPNKFPQFLFLLGLVSVAVNLVKRFSGNNFISMVLILAAVFGSHFIGIQMGTAMLDIVIAYLFLAALDSFLDGRIFVASVEFTFFFWSKPFIPLQITALFLIMLAAIFLFKSIGFVDIKLGFDDTIDIHNMQFKKALVMFLLLSVVIAGPFMAKSVYYSGTPLFPFAPGALDINGSIHKNELLFNSLVVSSKAHMTTKDAYGYGKSGLDFLKHLWLIAVPDKGVNNRYDYPVGLPYLVFLGPFLYMVFLGVRKKTVNIIPLFIILYWITWWFGSQQTRFLYIPVLLMMILVISEIKVYSKILLTVILFSLVITGISVLRANKNDFFLSPMDVLRAKDRELVNISRDYMKGARRDKVFLDYYDVAYAQFPVIVRQGETAWVLKEK